MVGALTFVLAWAPAPVDNPLKGLVPYAGERRARFPHSMEFGYLPLSELLVGPDRYDWRPLEKTLAEIAGRGHQTVFRIFVEYPGRKDGIPEYLLKEGLRVTEWKDSDGTNRTPDYRDPRLRNALRRFVAALGARYDADPRLGYITAGLLGKWGEWHDWPREDLSPPKEVQREVIDAYAHAFRQTPVLLRYPAGDDPTYARNDSGRFGYHDDSFAFGTLPEAGKDWYFMTLLRRAGPRAEAAWKTRPIGGEIRPEAWGSVFDPQPGPGVQDFGACVRATHATWLMDSGMFGDAPASPERRRGAEAGVRAMGYEITVKTAQISSGSVRLTLANRGVAPFYRPWPVVLALIDGAGRIVARAAARGRIDRVPPGKTVVWDERPRFAAPPGAYRLALGVPNPMKGGHPLGFANAAYGGDAKGWLTLGAYAKR